MPGPGRRFEKGRSGNPSGRPKQDQTSSPETNVERLRAFHIGLKETGYVEGDNVTVSTDGRKVIWISCQG